jgi:aryl-alcohol dehydrogenase-like predicted oxidoreductase
VLSDEQADYAAEHGMDLWAYTPPLSGAYDNPAKKIPDEYDHPGNTARLAALDAVAAEAGATRGHVVLAWLLSRGIRPMLGGSKLDQLDSALDRAGLKLTGEQLQHLNAADQSSWSSPYARP